MKSPFRTQTFDFITVQIKSLTLKFASCKYPLFLPDGIRPLPEPILTSHQGPVVSSRGKCTGKYVNLNSMGLNIRHIKPP